MSAGSHRTHVQEHRLPSPQPARSHACDTIAGIKSPPVSRNAAFLSTSNASAQDAPPERTTVRLFKALPICRAPQYVVDEFLRAEGFTNIEYVVKAPAAIRAALVAAT